MYGNQSKKYKEFKILQIKKMKIIKKIAKMFINFKINLMQLPYKEEEVRVQLIQEPGNV